MSHGVRYLKRCGGQQEALKPKTVPKKTILLAVAVRGVPNDRMKDVLHMSSELMFSSGDRVQMHQGIPGGRVAADRLWNFNGCESRVVSDGGLCLFVRIGEAVRCGIDLFLEGVVDRTRERAVASRDREVRFAGAPLLEGERQMMCGFWVESEQQDA